MADGDHEGDVFDADLAAVAEVEVEFVELVGDLSGVGSGALDEEVEGFAFEGEFFLTSDAFDGEADLLFPAFFRGVDFIEGAEVSGFFGPLAEAADPVHGGGAEEELDARGESLLEDFEEVFDSGKGALSLAGAVGAEEGGAFEPDDFFAAKEADGLKGFDGLGAFLEGVFGVVGDGFDDLVGEFVAVGSDDFVEESGGFFRDAAFICSGYDVDRHVSVLALRKGSGKLGSKLLT